MLSKIVDAMDDLYHQMSGLKDTEIFLPKMIQFNALKMCA